MEQVEGTKEHVKCDRDEGFFVESGVCKKKEISHTIACSANFRISLMALGALFLNATP